MRRCLALGPLLFVLGWTHPASAGLRDIVAVLELSVDGEAVREAEAQMLTDQLRSSALAVVSPGLTILTRENMLTLLPADTDLQALAGTCLTTAGRRLRSQYVMGGSIRKVGSRLGLTLEAYHSGTGALLGSRVLVEPNVDALVDAIGREAPDFVRAWAPGKEPAAGKNLMKTRTGEQKNVATAVPEIAPPPAGKLRVTVEPEQGTLLELTDPWGDLLVAEGAQYQASDAAVGLWRLRARAPGHEAQERIVELREGELSEIRLSLRPVGALTVQGDATAIEVEGPGGFFDRGDLPWKASGLPSGTYRIRAQGNGFGSTEQVVEVLPGQTSRVQLASRENQRPRAPERAPVVTDEPQPEARPTVVVIRRVEPAHEERGVEGPWRRAVRETRIETPEEERAGLSPWSVRRPKATEWKPEVQTVSYEPARVPALDVKEYAAEAGDPWSLQRGFDPDSGWSSTDDVWWVRTPGESTRRRGFQPRQDERPRREEIRFEEESPRPSFQDRGYEEQAIESRVPAHIGTRLRLIDESFRSAAPDPERLRGIVEEESRRMRQDSGYEDERFQRRAFPGR